MPASSSGKRRALTDEYIGTAGRVQRQRAERVLERLQVVGEHRRVEARAEREHLAEHPLLP